MRMLSKSEFVSFISLCLFIRVKGVIFYNAYTDVGTITGKIEDLVFKGRSRQYVSYLGIPYADYPVFGGRFQKLHLRDSFKEAYNATYFRQPCFQTGFKRGQLISNEQCLYLNIYAPVESTINPKKKYAVLIYIHGGNFLEGAAHDVSPEILAVAGDIIVVTVNYRLGILGFLSSGNNFAKGNYGLWDQQLAIRWVRYNIGSFGGDVDNISLMGHEAGAASVMLQSFYPGNKGLFQRVIALSGSGLSPWAVQTPNVRQIARELDCYNDKTDFFFSDEPLIECIRNKPLVDILSIQSSIKNIGPSVDGEFLIDHPLKIITVENNISFKDARNFYRSLDIITGITTNDGSDAILNLFSEAFGVSNFNGMALKSDEFEELVIPEILEPVFRNEELLINKSIDILTRNSIKYSVMFQYTNWTDPNNNQSLRENLLRLSTDANFVIPAVLAADSHSYTNFNSSTYIYKFTHRFSYNSRDPAWVKEASHGSDVLPVFGFPAAMMNEAGLGRAKLLDIEYVLSENMMIWISNFVKTGDPNEPVEMITFKAIPVRWPEYGDERPFIRFSTNMTQQSIGYRFGEPSTSFWTTLVPVLLESARHRTDISRGQKYFTAFRIEPDKVELVIIVLITASGLLVLTLLFVIVCACRYCT